MRQQCVRTKLIEGYHCPRYQCPRYQVKRPSEPPLRGPFSCRLGTDLGTLATLITLICVCEGPIVADQEGGRPLGGIPVVVAQDVRVGLQEEPDVGVPDPLADHLRAYAGLERTGGEFGTPVVCVTVKDDAIGSKLRLCPDTSHYRLFTGNDVDSPGMTKMSFGP
jgi:hypothetical protein